MTEQKQLPLKIKFYWDIGSTNSYFAFHLLRPLAHEFALSIEYIPFNLGYVFRHHNYVLGEEPKAKLKNRAADLKRWANRYDLPFRVPDEFPIKTSAALRGSLAMRRYGLEESYIEKLFSAYWEQNDPSIKGLNGLIPYVSGLGVSGDEFAAMTESSEIREELIETTQTALAENVFGAPTMVLDHEIYWGKDRFDFIRDHLIRLSGKA